MPMMTRVFLAPMMRPQARMREPVELELGLSRAVHAGVSTLIVQAQFRPFNAY
jgi:hypothetical protein